MPSSEQEWIDGDVADGLGAVADAFRSNFRTRGEIGAAIAVYRDGEKVTKPAWRSSICASIRQRLLILDWTEVNVAE